MRLMRLAEVPLNPGHRVFRHSPGRAVFVVVCIVTAIAGLLIIGLRQGSGLAYYIAGVLFLGALIMHRLILARFRPSNWLVRMDDEGLFLQFRSYLNHHFSEADQTVVFIPYHETRSASLVDERSEVPYRDPDIPLGERSTERHRRLVEIELSGDTVLLARAISDERARRPPNATLYKDYPVRMSSPTRVQVEWSVIPPAEVFLDAMRRHTSIAAPVDKRRDFGSLTGLSRYEQEAHLLELIDAGQTIDAIYIARKLYSYNLPQARDYIESLRSGGEH